MSRFLTKIKKKKINEGEISVAILTAGKGSKIKSYEPRSLLKLRDKLLIEHQYDTVNNCFKNPEIITVVGCHANKVIKKISGRSRVVENQLHEETNSSESLRLAFNNSSTANFMFMHGDLYFNIETLDVCYEKSFIIIDSSGMIKENEIGVTKIKNKASILSYGLPIKWGQIAFFTGKEYNILKNIMQKFEQRDKKKLSFEIINEIINAGGSFECFEPPEMKLLEIDRIKDIR